MLCFKRPRRAEVVQAWRHGGHLRFFIFDGFMAAVVSGHYEGSENRTFVWIWTFMGQAAR